jgi:hypothetical protein
MYVQKSKLCYVIGKPEDDLVRSKRVILQVKVKFTVEQATKAQRGLEL